MRIKKLIKKTFHKGNVCVYGLRGSGKDILFGNVIARRKLQYVSNTDYTKDERFNNFHYEDIDCGKNTYENFMTGKIHPYRYKYPDNTDIYLSDCGLYFPAQYCNELNKKYPYMPTFAALSRQLGECNIHTNAQALCRVWDKIREQSDTYILCRQCFVIFGIVFLWVRIYDQYDSANAKLRPLHLTVPLNASKEMKQQRKIELERYRAQHGRIENKFLIFKNKSKHDTRLFKKILEEGTA